MLVGLVVSGSIVGAGEYALVATALRKSERNQREYAFRVQAIAHEIKTPLTAIQGSSEIISDHLVPDEQRTQIAGMIHKESKKLTQLIHTFLDVERMATGSLALEKQQLDLAPLCQDLLERAQLYAARKRITIIADVPHVTIAADGDRSPVLGSIRMPTRIIHGNADPLVPIAAGHDLKAKIAAAQIDVIDGMGHDLPAPLYPRFADGLAAVAGRA
jgi:signal transduction histidine kinase